MELNPDCDDETEIQMGGRQDDWQQRNHIVDKERARRVLEYFLEHGELPDTESYQVM